MKSKSLKDEFKKMKVPEMDITINEANYLEEFVRKIKKQDKEDERYLLHNKVIPILVGLFILTIVMILTSVKTLSLFVGVFLCYLGLVSTLILLFVDYKEISKESYDLSLLVYLKQKEQRLKSWYSTPVKYQWTFTIFVSGLIMMIIGTLRDIEHVAVFIFVYLVILLMSWIIGEYLYRKRHKDKHQPLLKMISELKEELNEEQSV